MLRSMGKCKDNGRAFGALATIRKGYAMVSRWKHHEQKQTGSPRSIHGAKAALWGLCALVWLLGSVALAEKPAKAPPKAAADKAPAATAKAPAGKAPAANAAKNNAAKNKAAARNAPAARDAKAPTARRASNAFKPVDLNAQKHEPGWDRPYLLAAYGVVWLVLMIYIIGLSRRMRQTDADLLQLQRRLADADDE